MKKYILLHWLFALLCLYASAQEVKPAKPDTSGICCGNTVTNMPMVTSGILVNSLPSMRGLSLSEYAKLNGSSVINTIPAFLMGELFRRDKKYKAYMFYSGSLVYKFITYNGGKTYILKVSK